MHAPSVFSSEPENLSNAAVTRGPQAGLQVADTADVLILGAGASGLICAREAAARGLRVILLDRAAAPGRKLAVSGGGRSNFSNREVTPRDYCCGQPDFCGPALAGFTPADMLTLIRAWGLPFEEREHGQLFLRVPAQRLVEALSRDCRQRGCRIVCRVPIHAVWRSDQGFRVQAGNALWQSKALVLALGSPAWPQIGGSGQGYRLAQSLGHTIIPPRPALTPLLLPPSEPLRNLAGISLPVRISLPARAGEGRFWRDELLFTHEGLCGPAALKASLFLQRNEPVQLDFLPGQNLSTLLDAPSAGRQTPRALLGRLLPQRLADAVLPAHSARRKIAELSRAARREIQIHVQARTVLPTGTAGLKKAEVCAGGVDTREINPHGMASLRCAHLHSIGELLDVTGQLGGYNLHWAWASGVAAGRAVLPKRCG